MVDDDATPPAIADAATRRALTRYRRRAIRWLGLGIVVFVGWRLAFGPNSGYPPAVLSLPAIYAVALGAGGISMSHVMKRRLQHEPWTARSGRLVIDRDRDEERVIVQLPRVGEAPPLTYAVEGQTWRLIRQETPICVPVAGAPRRWVVIAASDRTLLFTARRVNSERDWSRYTPTALVAALRRHRM
jgi:hypothetical protein